MSLQIMTANRLLGGGVVYFGENEEWTDHFASAKAVEDNDGTAALLAEAEKAEANQLIVGPYLIKVERNEAGLQPLSVKEGIRAKGPTVHYGHGTPANSSGSVSSGPVKE
ncbi:DUF2849 domain-containing protein [Kiloniella majae]|uniref:DUF2849 domain-containing protein n=1 Tax=Kiloniella majae TaxID=1938558 RepID=UPI0015C50273|nr:DUF2849 domain-containing protein [Kiloniella majae]